VKELIMEPSVAVLRGLLAAVPDALLAVEPTGEIVFANDQAERLFGWSKFELVGLRVEVLVPERFAIGHAALRTGCVSRPETRPMAAGSDLRARRRDGSEFPAEITLSAFTTTSGTLVAAAIRDVTLVGRTEQGEQLQRLESLGQLAGGVAHDFNNLLGVILNYTALLGHRMSDPTAAADLGEIRAAAERGAALTRQLQTFARRDVVNPAPVDVRAVVRGGVDAGTHPRGEHRAVQAER
jgi:PAS domain S-box-containing protein